MRVASAILICTVLLLPLSTSMAAEFVTFTVDTLVVNGTRISTTASLASSVVHVLTRDQIEQSAAHNAAELLRYVPGLDVRRTGQTGGQTSVFMRGANSNQTLVLVDGVLLNSPFSGSFDLSSLSVANVDRIEIISGPQSLLYGSQALGGVVNVVTRKDDERPALYARGSTGSYRFKEGVFRGGWGSRGFHGSVAASGLKSDNDRINSDYRFGDYGLSAGWDISSTVRIGADGRWSEAKYGIPNDRFTDDPNDRGRIRDTSASAGMHIMPYESWCIDVKYAHTISDLDFEGPEPNPPYATGASFSSTRARRDLVDLQNVFDLGRGRGVMLGATFERLSADLESRSPWGDSNLDTSQESRAVFGVYRWRGRENWEWNIGGRLDDYTSFGSHKTWRTGARYDLSRNSTIRANIGSGFRAPTLADLYYPGYGNPELDPEESVGWDVGVSSSLVSGRIRTNLTWFGNRFDHLISFSSTTYLPENIAEAHTGGLESSAEVLLTSGWQFRASYTWLSTAEDLEAGTRLLRRAEHVGTVVIVGRIISQLDVEASILLVGDSADRDYSQVPAAEVINPGYAKWDLGCSLHLANGVGGFFKIENLFDADYEEAFGFPALGRTARVGATFEI